MMMQTCIRAAHAIAGSQDGFDERMTLCDPFRKVAAMQKLTKEVIVFGSKILAKKL